LKTTISKDGTLVTFTSECANDLIAFGELRCKRPETRIEPTREGVQHQREISIALSQLASLVFVTK